MPDRILTSHAGSLPRPESLISLNELRAAGEFADEETYTRMHVSGLQQKFDDAIVCVEYDPHALDLSNSRLLRTARR